MSNDLPFSGRIVKAYWIAPKMYTLIYVCDPALIRKAATKESLSGGVPVEELLESPKYALLQRVVRGKGVPQDVLEANPDWYERMNRGEAIEGQLRVDPFKKCAYRLNASELANGFQQFSVHQVTRRYSVNKSRFSGRRFETPVESYPHGYEVPPIAHENHHETWMSVDTVQYVSNHGRVCRWPAPPVEAKAKAKRRRSGVAPAVVSRKPGVLETLTVSADGYALVRGARVHRLVAQAFLPNPDAKTFVDHINGDRMDNRAVNLRWATPQQNAANTVLRCDNTSGAKGVKRNPSGTFTVRISGKGYGTYHTLEEAVAVHAKYDTERNGLFARK